MESPRRRERLPRAAIAFGPAREPRGQRRPAGLRVLLWTAAFSLGLALGLRAGAGGSAPAWALLAREALAGVSVLILFGAAGWAALLGSRTGPRDGARAVAPLAAWRRRLAGPPGGDRPRTLSPE